MKMRNLLSTLAVLIAVLGCTVALMLTASAEPSVTTTLSGPKTAAVGDQITLTLSVDPGMVGYTLTLDYDESKLRLDSTKTVSGWLVMDGGGQYVAAGSGEAEKDIFFATFTVLDAALGSDVTVKVKDILLTDADLNEPEGPDASHTLSIPIPKSSDSTLKALSVAGYGIGFAPDKETYYLVVPNEVTSLDVSYEVNDAAANAKMDAPAALAEGTNRIKITVTAENGTSRTYTLVVTRKGIEPELSSDSTLKALTIGQATISFSPDKTQYSIAVGKDVTKLTVNATPNHAAATVKVEGNELIAGETVTVRVIVTAEDGTYRTYYLHTTREGDGEPPVTTPPDTAPIDTDPIDTTPPVTTPPATTPIETNPPTTNPPVSTDPSVSTEPQDSKPSGKPSVPTTPQDPDPQSQTIFWLNAIYIIILVACLLVIVILLTLLIIYRRMNNNFNRQ